jgi:hypothetical protein
MRTIKLFTFILLLSVGSAFAGELDTYYLQQFGELGTGSSGTLLKSAQTATVQKCGMPLRHNLKRDWKQLEATTQKTLAKYLALPVLTGENTFVSSGGHFIIHYATSGADLPNPVAPYTVASWVKKVADIFEEVYSKEIANMGYSSPPNMPYPVYLQQLATPPNQVFGLTTSDILTGQSATSFISIDNDFSDSLYHPYNGLPALQITAAHEFHHAIQYGYNYYFQAWYAETTATWMEDEVYDSVNQLYDYSHKYLQAPDASLDTPSDGGYSRWIFNRLLAENHGQTVIRSVWEKLRGTTTTPNSTDANGDIVMLPVIDNAMKDLQSSLPTEFISFAKRLYKRDWLSHTSELGLLYSVPLTFAATITAYPVNQTTAPAATTSLSHYSIKYFRFTPSTSVTNLTITVNKTAGVQTTLFKKTSAGITEIPFNDGGTATTCTYLVNGFGVLNSNSEEVVLMAANTTSADNQAISFSTDGTVPVSPPPPAAGGSGGGCFIATAAYGSYLHPEVMTLREFRDRYLLTNIPGRIFVAFYYRVSPPIADFIREHDSARFIVRLLLAPVILAVKHLWTALAAGSIIALFALVKGWRMLPGKFSTAKEP